MINWSRILRHWLCRNFHKEFHGRYPFGGFSCFACGRRFGTING